MGLSYQSLYAPDGLGFNRSDTVVLGTVSATYAATITTATGTVAVTWTEPVQTPYCVLVSPVENMTWWITSKTTLGFTLNVYSTAGAGLAGGTVRCLITT